MEKKKIMELSTKEFNKMSIDRIRASVNEYYKNKIEGKTIIHVGTGMRIEFSRKGRKKTLSHITKLSAIVIKHLPKLLRTAKFIGTEVVKSDHPDVIAILVFLIECKINGNFMEFKVIVMKKEEGNFQYDLYDNKIIKK